MYLYEIILNSELQLFNNSKLLKEDPSLLNPIYVKEVHALREEYLDLERRREAGESGLRKQLQQVRTDIRLLSSLTFVENDGELFGAMMLKMIDGVLSRPNFSGYTFKEEMKSLSVQYILLYTHKFEPFRQSKTSGQYVSAFGYITTIIFNACVFTINAFKKEQQKQKEDFLETQKMMYRDPNRSTINIEEEQKRTIKIPKLDCLINELKKLTINEPCVFIIPADYKITEKDHDFILKYEHNISIVRDKGSK
jgi:hypothetical protein